ncbi:helix-turn-helix domain-containing protein [Azorhizobium sp. AG788]|uniref:TetR/AcrR family transcriptional regulator n=1 Tax=Azorhizobium sp. AG788 TaxID=2183897 RepID=UPI003138F15F
MGEMSVREQKRTLAREAVLDAAERLLRADGAAAFSMRELAAEAGVSFATPFNQFGSKAAIAQALSARRIDLMSERFFETAPPGDTISRVLAAVSIAVAVMLEEPQINRAIIRSLGFPGAKPSEVSAQSRALWAAAFGDGDGIDPDLAKVAAERVPEQLAIAFRGCLSFWIADEITDAQLPEKAQATAITVLLGFVESNRRADLLRW